MIELKNVTKLYGKVIGVNDVTLDLPAGAYGLLGPNGSGKSTLLNLLTGQLKPTIGSIKVLGETPRNNPKVHRQIGYCPGSEGFYSRVSAFDWVLYLTQLHGIAKPEAAERTRKALDLVGMTDAMTRPIATFSRGMRQRTKIAQAIAHDPKILILDEPFSGLDPVGRHEITEALKSWLKGGKSLIVASHILYEVESITNSFLLISGGRLLASGTASEVMEMLIPNEYSIKSDQPELLGGLLMQTGAVSSMSVSGDRLSVTSKSATDLVEQLPGILTENDIHISELQSSDESLQTLFSSLMKIHRGQL